MASVQAKDIPSEQSMFADIWNFYKEFYYSDNTDEFFDRKHKILHDIYKKYNTPFCKELLYVILQQMDRNDK
jgi:hypothetical protein